MLHVILFYEGCYSCKKVDLRSFKTVVLKGFSLHKGFNNLKNDFLISENCFVLCIVPQRGADSASSKMRSAISTVDDSLELAELLLTKQLSV